MFPLVAFGGGRGRILLDNVECVGDEARLEDCTKKPIGHYNCDSTHNEDAGVVCSAGIDHFTLFYIILHHNDRFEQKCALIRIPRRAVC